MKNEKDLGKEANPIVRQTIIDCAPDGCLGGCPECGDYMIEDDGKANCVYCEFSEPLEEWNKRD